MGEATILEPLTQEQMEELQDAKRLLPRMEFALKEGHKLTKGVHDCKPDCFKDGFVSCHEWWRLKEASAVRLLREKIRELPNRDNELRFLLPKATKTISLGKLDGGGIGRFKVMKIIDEVFGGVGK